MVIGFDALYGSAHRCKKNVGWKDSVAHYDLNRIEETLKLERQLKDGTYRPRPQKQIHITHPKPREAIGVAFRDRVYQRSLNDVAIYPAMSRQFTKENAACQKGKGTDYLRDGLDEDLRQVYRLHGLDACVLQCDIKGYYKNIIHAIAEQSFTERLPEEISARANRVLKEQYGGNIGYNPGSQMVQIVGISYLSPSDHYIKEKLRIRWYRRYMDDFVLIHPDKGYLEYCQKEIEKFIAEYGLRLHEKKTRIYPVKDGIKILGFTHRLTDTGKVIRIINPENVKAERKKLYRMAQMEKAGKIPHGKTYECFISWLAHARKGNSEKLITRMWNYYRGLWKEADDGHCTEK